MRVVIVDDSIIAREGLRRILEADHHEVVGVAGDVERASATVASTRPDAVVLDVRMPPTFTDEGITLAGTLRKIDPHLAVLVLSQYASAEYASRLLEGGAGGVGYLLKERISRPRQLGQALSRLAEGGTVIEPDLIAELLSSQGRLSRLTDREAQVLRLMAEGLSDRGIAAELFVSLNTVSTHAQRIYRKLGLPDTALENRRILAVLAFLQNPNR